MNRRRRPAPCTHPGCPQLTLNTHCETHTRQTWNQQSQGRPKPNRKWRNLSRKTRTGKPCTYCGQPADTTDHIVPRARGGTDNPANLTPACRSCNSRKGTN